ncbi:MAG: hypothetical protein ABI304_03690 [Rudaea sp.]
MNHNLTISNPRELHLLTPLLAGFALYTIPDPIACQTKIKSGACLSEPKQRRSKDYTNDNRMSPVNNVSWLAE